MQIFSNEKFSYYGILFYFMDPWTGLTELVKRDGPKVINCWLKLAGPFLVKGRSKFLRKLHNQSYNWGCRVDSMIKREGPTETRTRIAGFRVLSANHYTIRPRPRMTIFKIYFMHYFWFWIKWSNWVIVNLEDLLRNIIKLETWLFTWKKRYKLGNITIHLIRSIWTWNIELFNRVSKITSTFPSSFVFPCWLSGFQLIFPSQITAYGTQKL